MYRRTLALINWWYQPLDTCLPHGVSAFIALSGVELSLAADLTRSLCKRYLVFAMNLFALIGNKFLKDFYVKRY